MPKPRAVRIPTGAPVAPAADTPPEETRQRPDRRRFGICDECGEHRRLNPIYAAYAADIAKWLCDECKAKRIAALEAMYRGD